MPYEERLF